MPLLLRIVPHRAGPRWRRPAGLIAAVLSMTLVAAGSAVADPFPARDPGAKGLPPLPSIGRADPRPPAPAGPRWRLAPLGAMGGGIHLRAAEGVWIGATGLGPLRPGGGFRPALALTLTLEF